MICYSCDMDEVSRNSCLIKVFVYEKRRKKSLIYFIKLF